MTAATATDLLIELKFRLPNHTFKAVKRRAEELQGDEREAYLSKVLADRERSEAPKGAVDA
jgi:hypothetical protein